MRSVVRLKERIYAMIFADARLIPLQKEYRQTHGAARTFLYMLRLRWGGKSEQDSRRLTYPEYESAPRESAQALAERLGTYDVVSIDIFDTLLLRDVEKPADVFDLMGERLDYTGFRRLREEAETDSRRGMPGGETRIERIYALVHARSGLDSEKCIALELALEKAVCRANPYMKQVYDILSAQGKRIVFTSDMYWPAACLRELLENAGYTGGEEIFVSCDNGAVKGDGSLQRLVQERVGAAQRIVHIGDSVTADVQGSQSAGWTAVHYRSVLQAGGAYRPQQMRSLAGSVCKALCCNLLHSGAYVQDAYYAHGYTCGGPLVTGFCQWLNVFARANGVDRLLFAARDGYIVQKVYERYFEKVDHRYAYTSRYCMQQLLFDRHVDQFVREAILTRAMRRREKMTLREMLKQVGLETFTDAAAAFGLSVDTPVVPEDVEKVAQWMYDARTDIARFFQPARDAALSYYRDLTQGSQKAAVVDIGWRGTCGLYLRELFAQAGERTQIVNALVGCIATPDADIRVASGVNQAYLFSVAGNRDLYAKHAQKNLQLHSSLMELLFTSDQPSFLQFGWDEKGSVQFHFAPREEKNMARILAMQQGMMDFARDYARCEQEVGVELPIPAPDAYAPFAMIMDNTAYNRLLFDDYQFNELAGRFQEKQRRTIGQQIKGR